MPEIIPNWHPIFVHFSVALLSLSVLVYWLSHFSSGTMQRESAIVARWALWLGALAAVFTGVAGIVAYNSVAHDTTSHLAMTEHRNWALPTITLFVLLAAWSMLQHVKGRTVNTMFLLGLLLAGGLLASTAWHGAELVYRYGLGVMSLPDTDAHDHAGHAHGESDHAHDNQAGGGHHGALDAADMNADMDNGPMTDGANAQDGRRHTHDDGHDHQH